MVHPVQNAIFFGIHQYGQNLFYLEGAGVHYSLNQVHLKIRFDRFLAIYATYQPHNDDNQDLTTEDLTY